MSLLNQVLRDLDSRHAGELERQRIPEAVRPLPVAASRSVATKTLLLASGGLLVAIGLGWLLWPTTARAPAPRPAPAVAPVVVAAPPPVPIPVATSESRELKLDASELFASSPPLEQAPRRPASRVTIAAPVGTDDTAGAKPAPAGRMVAAAEPSLPVAGGQAGNVVIAPRGSDPDGEDYRRAQSQIEHGASAAAEALLRQILGRNPGHQAARQSLFNLLAASRRIDEAAGLLTEGLRLEPSRTGWAMNLARLQIEQGDNEAAWQTLQRGLPHATSQGDYQAFCGTVLHKLKKYSEAIERYQAALRINPGESRWWIGFALSLEAHGKPAEAREAFARAQATGKLTPELAAYVEGKLKQ